MISSRFISRLSALLGIAGVLGALAAGCGGGGGGGGSSSTSTGPNYGKGATIVTGTMAGRSACAANATTGSRARWTVLVFLNSSNNLNQADPAINNVSDALNNIAQMARVGSDSSLNIVVQWKQSNCSSCGVATFNETRRYRIKPHSTSDVNQILAGNTSVLDSDLLPMTSPYYNATTRQTDMGDWRVLQDFAQWGASNYPADNLAVVVWDHGSGWEPVPSQYRSVAKPFVRRAVSIDSATRNEIETEQLPGALAGTAQPIDALIFDASLMQMAEVEYEVRNSAKVMVGSEESPPGAGYPYDLWLSDLKSGGSDACAVGVSIVTRFANFYGNTDGITQSVIDLSKMQNVANALDAFGGALIQHRADQAPAIQNARNYSQNYKYPEFKDLYDFASRVKTNATATDLQQAATNVQAALIGSNGAIIAYGHNQNEAGTNGMAITVPDPNLSLSIASSFSQYLNLGISQSGAAPRWAQFLQQQVQ